MPIEIEGRAPSLNSEDCEYLLRQFAFSVECPTIINKEDVFPEFGPSRQRKLVEVFDEMPQLLEIFNRNCPSLLLKSNFNLEKFNAFVSENPLIPLCEHIDGIISGLGAILEGENYDSSSDPEPEEFEDVVIIDKAQQGKEGYQAKLEILQKKRLAYQPEYEITKKMLAI